MAESAGGAPSGVACTRNGVVESFHRVHAVVVEGGRVVAHTGEPDRITIYRSAAKPFQAIPLVTEGVVDRFGLEGPELALAAASHNGEPAHVETARRILEKVGAGEEALRLGPLAPLRPETAEALYRSGSPVLPVHNNCSGQHAAMLGLARIMAWPLDSYLDPAHPLQARMLAEVARFAGMDPGEIRTMPDGCGMAAFAVPLRSMALSFGTLAAASGSEEGPGRVLAAMAAHPFMVGGTGRLCSALPAATGGRMVGKLGGEGVYGVAMPEAGMGMALKVEDGGMRAVDAAVVGVLDHLGLLSTREAVELEPFRRRELRNTLGEVVGEIRAHLKLEGGRKA